MTDVDAQAGPPDFDPNEDRYPDITHVFAEIEAREELKKTPIDRVMVHAFASGEATYKVWPARAEEPVEGYIPNL